MAEKAKTIKIIPEKIRMAANPITKTAIELISKSMWVL